ncbi:MAG: transporter [Microbacterium sp.]|uniref:tripartite tricarboxylate transporter permease n=1 Tax=unclassified Microbacterium TaxID=2609290 RepID=UPI000DB8CB8C|nr:tripartite tricarboxylate transporter permease [Microbacterium sp.]PZU37566.1 MAG: transporter [Microbacterium sp.]
MGFDALFQGLLTVLTPENLLFALMGCVLGMLVGVLPGFGPAAAVSLLIPVTFTLSPTTAIIMLAAILYGAAFGGTITAVLLRIPGEASSVATTLDGYELAKQGRAGPALVIAAIGSFLGGLVGVLGFVAVAPFARIALEFGAPELFLVAFLGLSLITSFAGKNPAKALVSAGLGLAIATVGIDSGVGIVRFGFDLPELFDGISLVAIVMGAFGLSEILAQAQRGPRGIPKPLSVGRLFPTREDYRRSWGPFARGSVIGFFMGLLPGSPGAATSLASYAAEKRFSKHHRAQFGRGAIEGVAGPETANNALAVSSMIPLFTLGIPTSATVAIMAGAFTINGLIPGPLLFRDNPEVAWAIIASFLVGNVILLILNVPLVRVWVAVLRLPFAYLMAAILAFMFLGTFSIGGNTFEIYVMVTAGVIGYVFHLLRVPLTPLVLAIILGPMLEENFQRSLALSRGDWGIFTSSPIAIGLLVVCVVALLLGVFRPLLATLVGRRSPRRPRPTRNTIPTEKETTK